MVLFFGWSNQGFPLVITFNVLTFEFGSGVDEQPGYRIEWHFLVHENYLNKSLPTKSVSYHAKNIHIDLQFRILD